jgi:hypothetical protein
MTEENEVEVVAEDNEPVYFNPKALSLLAAITTWVSWFVLLGFILIMVAHFLFLKGVVDQGTTWSQLLADSQAKDWVYTNMLIPFLTGLGIFIILLAASAGLKVMRKLDSNVRNAAKSNKPFDYNPNSVSLIAAVATWFSWLVFIGFILIVVAKFFLLQEMGQGTPWSELLVNNQVQTWIYINMVVPFLTGLGIFIALQAAGIGLNVLLETDFNSRNAEEDLPAEPSSEGA